MTEALQAYLDTGLHAVAPLRNRVGRLLRRRWITPVTICAGTGLLGVLSGFALFVLMWREADTSVWSWVAILSCAATLSFIFEHLRAEIEGHVEERSSFALVVTTLVMLGVFELFAAAVHTAVIMKPQERDRLITAEMGPNFVNAIEAAVFNLLLMLAIWLLMGVIVGWVVGKLIPRFSADAIGSDDVSARRGWGPVALGAAIGGAGGACAGTVCILSYVLIVRALAYFKWMTLFPGAWRQQVSGVQSSIPWKFYTFLPKLMIAGVATLRPSYAILLIALSLFLIAVPLKRYLHPLWRALIGVNILAVATLLLAPPLMATSLSATFGMQVLKLVVSTAVVWCLPGLVLGATVSHLERPSENRQIWGFVAAGVAVLLAWAGRHGVAIVLGVVALLFLARVPIERFWPLLALSSALVVFGFTELTVAVPNFFKHEPSFVDIQEQSLDVLNAPIADTISDRFQAPVDGLNMLVATGDAIPIVRPVKALDLPTVRPLSKDDLSAVSFDETERAVRDGTAALSDYRPFVDKTAAGAEWLAKKKKKTCISRLQMFSTD